MASDGEEFNYSEDSPMEDDVSDTYSMLDYGDASMDESEVIATTYRLFGEREIEERQQAVIDLLSTTLFLSSSSATLLLSHHNWDVDKVTSEWVDNEAQMREAVGLLNVELGTTESASADGKQICGICFETVSITTMRSAACGHNYCTTCWRGYIACSINDGPGCLSLRCPYRSPSCRAAIDRDMVESLSTENDRKKYKNYLLRSYVEGQKKTKWCPSPGCEYAVEFLGLDLYDVKCKCSHFFCWACTEEAHRPVKCETVAKWAEKNKSDAENTKWLLANSKPCPKCKRFIEKNHGCMHMTCTPPCRFEFCWLCLGDWREHGNKTGGYYACNTYEKDKQKGKYDQVEARRRNAKESLVRYTHYFERWNENHNSMVKAMETLNGLKNGGLDDLTRKLEKETVNTLDFIVKAWVQIVECRRMLKWSYAHGYFLPAYQVTKKMLFEDLQGQAESDLERLHGCAETEFNESFLLKDFIADDFRIFQVKLLDFTAIAKKHFEKLVQAFESGLDEVNCEEPAPSSTNAGVDGMDLGEWYCEKCNSMNSMASSWCEKCYGDQDKENNPGYSSQSEED